MLLWFEGTLHLLLNGEGQEAPESLAGKECYPKDGANQSIGVYEAHPKGGTSDWCSSNNLFQGLDLLNRFNALLPSEGIF